MDFFQYNLLQQNHDDDINPNEQCAQEADAFSQRAIPLIIKDDLEGFIDLVSSAEFNWDGNFPHARDRMYLSNYLYQPFFDELTGPTALCFAAFFNAEKIVDFILGLPDVDKADAFHFACAGGSFNVMRTLFDQSQCDLINKDNLRPLNIASYFGNVDVVKYLWAHGCKIISSEDTYSSVNKAAFNGNINVLEFFKEVDPNLLKKMKDYKHPIISAAIGGQPECVKYFIELGEINRSTISSALIEACRKGSLSCVKILSDAYINYMPPKKPDENKKTVRKTKSRRKKKAEEEFVPKKGKRRNRSKKKEYSDESDSEEEENDSDDSDKEDESEDSHCLPFSAFILAVKKRHIDVLRFLLSITTPEPVGKLLCCAIEQINFQELSNGIFSNNHYSFMLRRKQPVDKEKIKNNWIQKSLPAVKIAKFILEKVKSNDFIVSLFKTILEDGKKFKNVFCNNNINNAIYFLDQINFKIVNEDNLTDDQIDFLRYAILNANSITIPIINKILNNHNIDFFESKSYEKLRDKAIAATNQVTRHKKQYIENDDEYQEELRLMNDFQDYITILSQRKYTFQSDSAVFLIENNFPFYIFFHKKVKNINNCLFLMSAFFEACIKMGKYDYAIKFLGKQSSSYIWYGLKAIFKEANKIFNKGENEEAEQDNEQLSPCLFNDNQALNYIYDYNKKCSNNEINENNKENDVKNNFNIFNYQCKNEDETEKYQQLMTMIKLIIKMSSYESQIAILLCENGLNKEWIIQQMNGEDENGVLDYDTVKIRPNISYYSFYGMSQSKPINPNLFENNSVNPIINLAKIETVETYLGFQFRSKITELLKYYINHGIDLSSVVNIGILWKYLIDANNGFFINILIKYGNPDKEILIEDSISLFDYAIDVKAVNILYVFFNHNFYSTDSLAKDPNALVNRLNKEKIKKDKKHENSEVRKNNLKIIMLIYRFLGDNYDQKLKSKLISEFKSRLKPTRQSAFF